MSNIKLGRLRVDVILPILSELQICQGFVNRSVVKIGVNLDCTINGHMAKNDITIIMINSTSNMYCQYCITARYDLIAIPLVASDTTIHICPC